MPIIKSSFKPAWWLPNAHLQTLWSTFFRHIPDITLNTNRLTLPDNDFLDISVSTNIADEKDNKPIVLILHGLEGSIDSPYAKPLINTLVNAGYGVYFMHFRGCSGEINKSARSYHSGETGDLQFVVDYLTKKHQCKLSTIIGFSLGGNVLLKWLGEQGEQATTLSAVAVSVPFKLADAAKRMEKGFSKVYQRHLISRLQKKYHDKFSHINSPLSIDIKKQNTFYQFDDQVTAPLHHFKSAEDYYLRCSSRQFVKKICIPTLILHATDDPFMFPNTAPSEDELSKNVQLELSSSGGHVGFVAGKYPWKAKYWVDIRVLEWLKETLK
ncbi:MAG: hydrolase [Aquificaceae bacterium]|nr:MAG: hydrolase [Aquificaceae bacterium]